MTLVNNTVQHLKRYMERFREVRSGMKYTVDNKILQPLHLGNLRSTTLMAVEIAHYDRMSDHDPEKWVLRPSKTLRTN